MNHRSGRLWAAVITLVVTANVMEAAETYEVTLQVGVRARMRDGVFLRADIYRPSVDGRFPVLLQRTPYDKRNEAPFAIDAAAHGFVAIVQDVRGRYSSEGEWYPFRHESDDGYDTVEWAASLPVLEREGGYVGRLLCGRHPDACRHRAPAAPGRHLPGGDRQQLSRRMDVSGRRLRAMVQPVLDVRVGSRHFSIERSRRKPTPSRERRDASSHRAIPLFNFSAPSAAPVSIDELAPYYLDWLAHPDDDDYWKPLSIEAHYENITVPVLSVAAWYDIFQGGSLRNYLGIKAHGGSEEARRGQHLLVIDRRTRRRTDERSATSTSERPPPNSTRTTSR